MYEDFGTILNKGFKSWVRNLNICIPFALSLLINMTLYVLFFGLMGYLLFTSSTGSITDPATLSQEELFSMMWKGFSQNLTLFIFLVLGFFLLVMFVQSFFTAGAIGMAKKASETGDTVLSDMLASGSKNNFRLFLAVLLISLLSLAGIVFLVPGVLAFRKSEYAGRKSGSFDTGNDRARHRRHPVGSLHNNSQSCTFPHNICSCNR